jgi:hypothetical protein
LTVLVFATSDKGGTGRSVTSSNLAYRRALQGSDVAYLDFDFGSPTAGSIFQIPAVERGIRDGGLHSYIRGDVTSAARFDVWDSSERDIMQGRPDGAGQLTLFPGDLGGGEFSVTPAMVGRCIELFQRLEAEFDVTLVDLSAGRSFATQLVLEATADKALAHRMCRWLVFHRWTRQHIIAAAGLIYGTDGIVDSGGAVGHDSRRLAESVRTVRTAVVNPDSDDLAGLRPAQIAWLRKCNEQLQRLSSDLNVGRLMTLGDVPLDPLLQWREQLISDTDTIRHQIANQATVDAFELIAKKLTDAGVWVSL